MTNVPDDIAMVFASRKPNSRWPTRRSSASVAPAATQALVRDHWSGVRSPTGYGCLHVERTRRSRPQICIAPRSARLLDHYLGPLPSAWAGLILVVGCTPLEGRIADVAALATLAPRAPCATVALASPCGAPEALCIRVDPGALIRPGSRLLPRHQDSPKSRPVDAAFFALNR